MRILTSALIGFGLAAAAAGTAGAGSLDQPATDPVPVAPIEPTPVPVVAESWTGGYVGLSFGLADVDVGAANESGALLGLHAGYDYDFGRFVMGGEVEFNSFNDLSLAGTTVDSVARVKLRGGADLGRVLVYGTAGAAEIDTGIGTQTGPFVGIGLAYRATDRFTVGAEYLGHQFTDIGGTGVDSDARTLNLRGSLRF